MTSVRTTSISILILNEGEEGLESNRLDGGGGIWGECGEEGDKEEDDEKAIDCYFLTYLKYGV